MGQVHEAVGAAPGGEPPGALAAASHPPAAAAGRYYTDAQVAVGAFLGSPLVGGYLVSRNRRLLGLPGRALGPLLAGVLALLFLAGLGFIVQGRIGRSLADLCAAVLFGLYARRRFGAAIALARAQGGRRYSWWRLAGVVFGCIALLVAMLAPLGWALLH